MLARNDVSFRTVNKVFAGALAVIKCRISVPLGATSAEIYSLLAWRLGDDRLASVATGMGLPVAAAARVAGIACAGMKQIYIADDNAGGFLTTLAVKFGFDKVPAADVMDNVIVEKAG